jgi:hypothetical protein
LLLSWVAFAWIVWHGAMVRISLGPAACGVVLVAPVLAGAVVAVLARALLRPFGGVAWGWGWLGAGIAVVVGTCGGPQHELMLTSFGKWQLLLVVAAPAAAVFRDWWTRFMQQMTGHAAAAGQLPLERAQILNEMNPVSVNVVKYLPMLLLVGGVLAGHFPGAAIGRAIAPEAVAEVGADLGALVGRVAGAVLGALLTVGLLRLYRVEEGAPWPGQGNRAYPRALAALYLAATAGMAIAAIRLL